jgi:hypothetical protein
MAHEKTVIKTDNFLVNEAYELLNTKLNEVQ